MSKRQKQPRKRSSNINENCVKKHSRLRQNSSKHQKGSATNSSKSVLIAFVFSCVVCIFVILWRKPNFVNNDYGTSSSKSNKAEGEAVPHKKLDSDNPENLRGRNIANQKILDSELFKDFRPHILNRLQVKSTNVDGKKVKVTALQHGKKVKRTSVRAYVLENFLSEYECDALAAAHDNHVTEASKLHPLLCFDSVNTFEQNLREIGLTIKVSSADFLKGTTCINESLSLLVRKHGMNWSYSTSFYPGESKFSLTLQDRIKQATGLSPENGGKFQITSYPRNVGYKNHTDCVVGLADKRDRFATILVYLKDVAEGGETVFPQLGLKVTPKKGLALVWNSMTKDGQCDLSSIHNAAQVIQGHKYILQRWYYYHNFPSLGKRMPEPSLPYRKANQPRVSCDQYEFGSCRWYDEWNYDHITDYVRNQHDYL